MNMEPTAIVNHLLENVEKWDNVCNSFRTLYGLRHKSMGLYREMARAYEYERELARAGLTRAEVSHQIRGSQIGSTHNYKKSMPVRLCANKQYCSRARLGKPSSTAQEQCSECGDALQDANVPISASTLRDKMADHIVGVETTDGRTIFFDKPLHPTPWIAWE